MARKIIVCVALAALGARLILGPQPALAHHSVAMFDMAHTVRMSGTIKVFEWTNPHTVIWFVTDDEKQALWPVETTSPGNLMRSGWTKHSLNPGDKVTVALHPLRDGRNGGALESVTLADGTVLSMSLQNNRVGD